MDKLIFLESIRSAIHFYLKFTQFCFNNVSDGQEKWPTFKRCRHLQNQRNRHERRNRLKTRRKPESSSHVQRKTSSQNDHHPRMLGHGLLRILRTHAQRN